MEVDFGGLLGLVTEPKGDLSNVVCGLKGIHGAGVAHDMGRDPFTIERGAVMGCHSDMLGEDVLSP